MYILCKILLDTLVKVIYLLRYTRQVQCWTNGELKMKYTDDQIADACMECVNDWDMDTLLQFAYEEMFHYYTEVASAAGLADFMQEMSYED